MEDQETLRIFGQSFQHKVLCSLIVDQKFIDQSYDLLNENYFDSDSLKWIVKKIKEYYEKYHIPPTMEVFKAELDEVKQDARKEGIIHNLRNVFLSQQNTDLQYVKEKYIQFARNQELKKAILDSTTLLNKGKYDEIRERINEASKVGMNRDIGLNYKTDLERRISDTVRNVIETPWDVLNEIMDGGLGKGELGVVISPSGGGKCIGGNTEIEIEYEEYGLQVRNTILWFKPWDKVKIENKEMFVWQAVKIIEAAENQKEQEKL